MNRRIRKKKDKKITEAINGLVSIAERREQQRQAAIRQFVKLMLSRLVDTFFSRTSWTMLLYAENHSISVA